MALFHSEGQPRTRCVALRFRVLAMQVLQNEVVIEDGEITAEASCLAHSYCPYSFDSSGGLCCEPWLPGGSAISRGYDDYGRS